MTVGPDPHGHLDVATQTKLFIAAAIRLKSCLGTRALPLTKVKLAGVEAEAKNARSVRMSVLVWARC